MSIRSNSGFLNIDRRFGTSNQDISGSINREQYFLERLNDRLLPVGFNPPAPTVWLDANTTYITKQGTPSRVDLWNDRSGNNLHANGPGSTDDPLYNTTDTDFNNLGSVDFGTNDWLETSTGSLLNCADGFTTYIVTNLTSYPSTFNMLLAFTNTTSWSQGWGMLYYSGNWRFYVNNWNNTATRVDMGPFTDYTNTHIFKFHYDKVNITGQIIGPSAVAPITKAYTTAVTNPSSEGIRICDGNSSTFQINAKVGEILYYNTPLTAADQLLAETYLKTKFNII